MEGRHMAGIRQNSGLRLVVLACLLAFGGTASAQTRLTLLNPDEASRLRLSRDELLAVGPTLRGTAGPRILFQEPIVKQTSNGPVIETTPSTSFLILFEANGSPVDMESLEIKAKKGILSMSLTPRLKPFIEGTSLKAASVSVPEGRFLIQIEILDKAGARAVEQYRLDVRQ
jgi:hypothetical protein